MPNHLSQPNPSPTLDAELATLLYLLHTQALCQAAQPNPRSVSTIHHLLRALLSRADLSQLLRSTCEDLRDTWSNAAPYAYQNSAGSCA